MIAMKRAKSWHAGGGAYLLYDGADDAYLTDIRDSTDETKIILSKTQRLLAEKQIGWCYAWVKKALLPVFLQHGSIPDGYVPFLFNRELFVGKAGDELLVTRGLRDVEIRGLELHDCADLLDLYAEQGWVTANVSEVEALHDLQQTQQALQNSTNLGAFVENQLVGFFRALCSPCTGHAPPISYLLDLVVHPHFRGRGIAHALTVQLAHSLYALGIAEIRCIATPDAHALYAHYATIPIGISAIFLR